MKKISLLFTFCFALVTICIAQTPPNAFNYSAVARNASGQPIANATIGIQITILKTSPTGVSQYSENHFVNTDAFGLFNLVIGAGAVQSGSMATIDWSNDNYYLKVGMDANGGTNFLTMGTTQLLSVPYALYAASSGNTSAWNNNSSGIHYNNGNVAIGNSLAQTDAVLDLSSGSPIGSRGLLIPRLTTTQINNIYSDWGQCSPGLLVYNIDDQLFYYNSSTNLSSPPAWASFPNKTCPTNFIAVCNEFCIQNNPQSASTWESAANACQNFTGNAHLCSPAEWFTACSSSIPIFGMTNSGGEWVDNYTSATDALFMGNGTCSLRGEAATSTQKQYRCCFKR